MENKKPKRKRFFSPNNQNSSPTNVPFNDEMISESELNLITAVIKEQTRPLIERLENLEENLEKKNEEIKSLKSQIMRLEAKQRCKNFKIFGLAENNSETVFDTQRRVQEVFKKSDLPPIWMEKAYRVGNVGTKNRPVLVELIREADRNAILAKRDIIRHRCKVFLEPDYSEEIENRRNELRPILTAIRKYKQGNRSFHAVLRDDKLLVDSQEYGIDNLNELPVKLENLFTPSNKTTLGFYKKYSPLSNHHPAKQVVNNIEYNCNEQYYLHKKAIHFGDHFTAKKIKNEDDPIIQKRLSKKIENVNEKEWSKIKDKIMFDGLAAKFSQNANLKHFLLNTGNKVIVECNPYDKYWGIGRSLYDHEVWSNKNLPGNRMGKLLMELRSNISLKGLETRL